jgi:phage terminase large subunit-like protein
MSFQRPQTYADWDRVHDYCYDIINNLDTRSLNELLSGYENDYEALFNSIIEIVDQVVNKNFIAKPGHFTFQSLTHFEESFEESLRILSYNYFKTVCLPNFVQGWRNVEWGNMVQLYPWVGFLCARGSGKCLSPGTEVVMFDGSLKKVEDIILGDLVMGIDSTPRTVVQLHSGVDDMYEVEQKQNLNYTVNSRHTMHFEKQQFSRHRVDWDVSAVDVVEMPAVEFYNKKPFYVQRCFGRKVEGWILPEKDFHIEPYYLGLWLGDGCGKRTTIASIDPEVISYVKQYAQRLNLRYAISKPTKRGYSIDHRIVASQSGVQNLLLEYLRFYNVLNNKHIPLIYLQGSVGQRLELLAGLLDSDGSLRRSKKTYVFSQKSRLLTEQVQQLCWSLGFRANISEHTYKTPFTKTNSATTCQLHISGKIWKIPCKVERKKISFFEGKKPTTRCGISMSYRGSGEYFGFGLDGDHLFLLKDGTVVKNSFEMCQAWPLWRMYSYRRPNFLESDTRVNRNRKDTVIITNESKLGRLHLTKIADEIRMNDLIGERLRPDHTRELGKEKIECKNGATTDLRTFGSFIRGLHVGGVAVDDFLDKSCIYSKEQREKFKEVFRAEIQNIVEPGGNLVVTGTPFHNDDLYADLKKDPQFKMFEYPGIFPDGKLLAPERFSYKHLMDLKISLGSIVFAREVLVTPVSDDSSLFPWDYLNTAFVGMENISLVENIESFPIKLERIEVGCDFAISGNVGADYCVFEVWGIDSNENYYLLHVWRKQGASHNEQVSMIARIDRAFRPNRITIESNGFQRIMGKLAEERGLTNIEEFITTSQNKKDLYEGLPSLSAMFERGQIKIPCKEGYSKDMALWLCGEFNSITINEDKGTLESSDQHDDGVMSGFIAITQLRQKSNKFRVSWM